jgi:uncharacterized protein YcfJ
MRLGMHARIALVIASMWFTGCTGEELKPTNATQTGAAVGAVTGAVIGYNSGHHHGRNAAVGALAGAAAGAAIGNAADESNRQPVNSGGWE